MAFVPPPVPGTMAISAEVVIILPDGRGRGKSDISHDDQEGPGSPLKDAH